MTIYFAGTELDAMAGGDTQANTDAHGFDANYSRSSLKLYFEAFAGIDLGSMVGDSSATGWWAHFRLASGPFTTSANLTFFEVKDTLGNIVASLGATAAAVSGRLYSYQSGTFTELSTGASIGSLLVTTWDVHCYTSGGDSFFDVYLNSLLLVSISRVTDSNGGFKTGTVKTPQDVAGRYDYFSEVVVADMDTRGYRVKTLVPIGAGTEVDWTGTFAEIDEIVPDADSIQAVAIGNIGTFTTGGLASANMAIAAVCVNGIISNNGVNDVQAVLRKGSVNYPSADIGVTSGAVPYCTVFNDDPSTGTGWLTDDLTAVEFGFKAVV